jgi:hypothetical protein
MSFGFIIIRHVNNKLSDFYWKECYTCIRKFHEEPIIIIDDNSNKNFLIENLALVNTTVIYDTEHKGAAELLPYYYFHHDHPFDKAIILHDSVFLQQRLDITCDTVKYLWTYQHLWDNEIYHVIHSLLENLPHAHSLMSLFWYKSAWNGPFGMMSVISWNYINEINHKYDLWNSLLPKISTREHRMALERILGLIFCQHSGRLIDTEMDTIHSYMRWGTTFLEYLKSGEVSLPLIKVWSGR